MSFASIITAPILAGLAAGLLNASRRVPISLAVLCVVLGVTGATEVGMDPDTTERAQSILFATAASLIAALLVYGAWSAGRRIRRSRFFSTLAVLALASAVLFGCGGSEDQTSAVEASGGDQDAKVVEVKGDEYAYVMPDRIEGGVVTMAFSNTGKEVHEYALVRLAPGVALDDVRAELTDGDGEEPDPRLLTDVGGVPMLSPGRTVTVTRELAEGTYVLLCFFPAPDGKPHIQHGMLRTFEVVGESVNVLPHVDAVIVAGDRRFDVPELKAGRQTIELRNSASKEREFQLVGLVPGKTVEDAERWAQSGFRGPAPAIFPGGMQSIPPGTSVFEELDLEAGVEYLLTDEYGLEARFTVDG